MESVPLKQCLLQIKGMPISFQRDALDLLVYCSKIPKEKISSSLMIDSSVEQKWQDLCKRLLAGEPYVYLVGEIDFFHTKLKITKDVLIPRVETEWMVDLIHQTKEVKGKVLDLCAGSGCIGLGLKKMNSAIELFASDVQEKCIALCKENAQRNQLEYAQIKQGDFLKPWEGEVFDLIVCNPPYISEKEKGKLDISVEGYEPHSALFAKEDGLYFYRLFAKEGKGFLKPRAKAYFEIGFDQGQKVRDLFVQEGWPFGQVLCDLSGHERVFCVENG